MQFTLVNRIWVSTCLVFAAAIVACPFFSQDASSAQLSSDDRKMLLSLIGDPLTDPTEKQYCTVTIAARSCWGSSGEFETGAWYQPASDMVSARVYFLDNDWISAPKEFKRRDFVDESRSLLEPDADSNDNNDDDDFRHIHRRMSAVSAGSAAGTPGIVRAAWLAKLGHDELAAKTLARARIDEMRSEIAPTNEELIKDLRIELAWRAYADGVHAYMQRADEESLRHISRLNDKYAELAAEFGNGKELFAELNRRKEAQTFGEAAPEKPIGFDHWEKSKQAHWLIGQLDQVDARQYSQPGGVDLASDWRVEAIIAIGDPAIDELIDTLEQDTRLTRSVHFWRDFSRNRTVLSVREAALTAAMSILKVRVFEPVATGDNFTNRGHDKVATTVASLRRYWKKYRDTPFENRMMDVLTNPASDSESLREAAQNLAQMNEQRTLATTVFSDTRRVKPGEIAANPAIKKFTNPTSAEAILAAMDRELLRHDAQNDNDRLKDYERQQIEDIYLQSLVQLGDDRIVTQLRQRCGSANSLRLQCQLIQATFELGDAESLNAFAAEFLNGKIRLSTNDEDDSETTELEGIVRMLGTANTPSADAALAALTLPNHPYFEVAARGIQRARINWVDETGWFVHPYCIALLRRELDDKTPTGTIAMIKGDENYVEKSEEGTTSSNIPDVIADPASRRQQAELRHCDIAGEKLSALVIGLPEFHPLMKDVDQRLDSMRKLLDTKSGSLRRATD
ncbi:MAG: hypothetical protein KDA91_18060, partial [Planctomycetaceae bacterium]|nr:hypothetical protein [Planctomycetaceae bacterium]